MVDGALLLVPPVLVVYLSCRTSMRAAPLLSLALVLGLTNCGDLGVATKIDTGLAGVVLRGPVQPTCQIQVSCDLPFGATFTAQQGGSVIAAFRSDALGHFRVNLLPGTYLIVPGPDAPIISPGDQAKEVVVGSDGLTNVQLDFDTGIR